MPTYKFSCKSCLSEKSIVRPVSDTSIVSCVCGESMSRCYSRASANIVCEGDASPSQVWREERQRKKRHLEIGVKQIEKHSHKAGKAIPNVNGEEFDSWSEAQSYAKANGFNHESYTPMVVKEKNTDNASGADEAKYALAKEALRRGGL